MVYDEVPSEGEEALLESASSTTPVPPPRYRQPKWYQGHYNATTVLIASILGALSATAIILFALFGYGIATSAPSEHTFTPDLSFNAPRTFTEHKEFLEGPDWQKHWVSLQPSAKGFVVVPNPSQYGLTGGFPFHNDTSLNKEVYCISAFHQLHCLESLKKSVDDVLKVGNTAKLREKLYHLDHCFDYLRQAVMCNGDMTLEKMRLDENGNRILEVSGWDVVHRECRNWDRVKSFAEEKGAAHRGGG